MVINLLHFRFNKKKIFAGLKTRIKYLFYREIYFFFRILAMSLLSLFGMNTVMLQTGISS